MAANQLRMVHTDLASLPDVVMPEGYELRTYRPGDEAAWAEIMNTGVGEWTAESCREKLTGQPQFIPEGLFFAVQDGRPVGSACSWRSSADEWEKGYLHMVCVLPDQRGKQLGYLLTLAVLRFFHERGFREVWLSTDDWRIPAIKSYLRLGFEPDRPDESHIARWKAVFDEISKQSS